MPSASPSAPAPSIAPSPSTATPSVGPSGAARCEPRPDRGARGRLRARLARRDRVRPASRPVTARGRRSIRQVRARAPDRDRAAGPRGTGRGQRLLVDPRRAGRSSRSTAASPTDGWRSPITTARRGSACRTPRWRASPWRESTVDRGPVSVADARRTAADINAFGLALYRRLLGGPDGELDGKGVVMSPTSIATALAMARAGRQGLDGLADGHAPARQRLGRPRQRHRIARADPQRLQRDLEGRRGHAPRALAEHGQPRLRPGRLADPAGVSSTGSAARSGPDSRSSTTAPTPTPRATTINAWVARQTHDRIKKLLGPDRRDLGHPARARERDLPEGQLAARVRPQRTVDRAFTTSLGASVRVPTMRMDREQDVPLAHGTGWQATALRMPARTGRPSR